MGNSDRENNEAISEIFMNLKDEFKNLFCIPQKRKSHDNKARCSNTDRNARPLARDDLRGCSDHQSPGNPVSDQHENQNFNQTREAGRHKATANEEQGQPHYETPQPAAASTFALRASSTSQGTGFTDGSYQQDGSRTLKRARISNSNNRPDGVEHGGPAAEPRPPPIPPKHGQLDGCEFAESSTDHRQQHTSSGIRHDDQQTRNQEQHAQIFADNRGAYAAASNDPMIRMDHPVSENTTLEHGYDSNSAGNPELLYDAHGGQPDPTDRHWRYFPALQGPVQIYSDANDAYTEQYLRMQQELQKKDEELQSALRCHQEERNSDRLRIKGLERALREREERERQQLERRSKPSKRDRIVADQKARIATLESQNNRQKGEISRLHQVEQSLQRDYSHEVKENGALDRRLQEALHAVGLRIEEIQNLRSVLHSTQVDLEQTKGHVLDAQHARRQAEIAYEKEVHITTQRQQENNDKFKALEERHLEHMNTSATRHTAEMESLKEEYTKQLLRARTDHEELLSKLAVKDLRIAAFSSSGNYKPIHDSGFGQAFQKLSQQVKNLTAYIPTTNHTPVDSDLDSTNYLGRRPVSSRVWQNFVRSVCWEIIIRGFFACQLGFGSLGSQGEGFQSLLMFYQLFARPGRNQSNSKSLVFPTDKETNLGRAWFFEGILQSVRSNTPGDGFASMFQKNVSKVAIELTSTLQRLRNGSLGSQAETKILNLMREFGELALQMGSQRPQVFLEVCKHGDLISPGERFTEESEARGMVEVDLMIQPGLVRIGDGREDLSSEAVIAKGSIVSLKGASNQ